MVDVLVLLFSRSFNQAPGIVDCVGLECKGAGEIKKH